MDPITLATPRLRLRPWRDEDLEPFARLNADLEVTRFFPASLTRAESDAMAARHRGEVTTRGWGKWAAELPGIAPFIGYIGLGIPSFEASFTPCVEIGWRLDPRYWGQGLAPEGARAVLAFAFGTLGVAEVVAFTSRLNRPSIRVMEKLGMVEDPGAAFDNPLVPEGHPSRPYVLYRVRAAALDLG